MGTDNILPSRAALVDHAITINKVVVTDITPAIFHGMGKVDRAYLLWASERIEEASVLFPRVVDHEHFDGCAVTPRPDEGIACLIFHYGLLYSEVIRVIPDHFLAFLITFAQHRPALFIDGVLGPFEFCLRILNDPERFIRTPTSPRDDRRDIGCCTPCFCEEWHEEEGCDSETYDLWVHLWL